MRLVFAIMGQRKNINFKKLKEINKQLKSKDSILVSGTPKQCAMARVILGNYGIKQNRILLDIKGKGIKNFVKEYINEYDEMTFISENEIEELLLMYMFHGKIKDVRIEG